MSSMYYSSGMTTTQPAPIITVTWDTVMTYRTTHYSSTFDETVQEPVSLGELVVAGIVERLTAEIKADGQRYNYTDAVRQAKDAAVEAARVAAEEITREVLTGEIRLTNVYGESRGGTTTLRDLIR